MKKSIRRALATTAVSAALLGAGAAAASAHVGVDPNKTNAGSYALLTFGIPHGCGESATTKVTITLPEELNDAQPTVNASWDVKKVSEKLDAPKKLADGSAITERTKEIVYTAKTPLDPELRDALVLSLKLPEDAEGKTLRFPTLQNCEQGETDWSEVPADGQDEESVEHPAPSFVVTAASAEGHGHGTATTAEATESADAAHASSTDSASNGAAIAGWSGLVAGVAGLGLGGIALSRSRTKNQG